MLVLMLLAGCALGWLGKQVHAARGRAQLVERIESIEGSVGYDYQFADGRFKQNSKPQGLLPAQFRPP